MTLYIYIYSRWVIYSVMSESLWLLSFLSYSLSAIDRGYMVIDTNSIEMSHIPLFFFCKKMDYYYKNAHLIHFFTNKEWMNKNRLFKEWNRYKKEFNPYIKLTFHHMKILTKMANYPKKNHLKYLQKTYYSLMH